MNKLVIVCLALVAFQLGRIEASNLLGFWEYEKESDINQLHLYKGRLTSGNAETLQLECKENGRGLCSFYSPDEVVCTNTAYKKGVAWDCKAKLSHSIQFDSTVVFCEHTDPEYVIVGSCALQYTLKRV